MYFEVILFGAICGISKIVKLKKTTKYSQDEAMLHNFKIFGNIFYVLLVEIILMNCTM